MTQSRNVRSRYRCSMCPAIHINSRSWLRSSSTHEPSDPPPRVVFICFFFLACAKSVGSPVVWQRKCFERRGRPACYALFFIDVRVKENKNSMEEGKQAGNEPTPVERGKTRVPVNLHPPRRSATRDRRPRGLLISITEGDRCFCVR